MSTSFANILFLSCALGFYLGVPKLIIFLLKFGKTKEETAAPATPAPKAVVTRTAAIVDELTAQKSARSAQREPFITEVSHPEQLDPVQSSKVYTYAKQPSADHEVLLDDTLDYAEFRDRS